MRPTALMVSVLYGEHGHGLGTEDKMVKATEWTMAQALAGEKQFQVPLFQRVYSWGSRKPANS